MISRESMLTGLLEVEGGGAALPFVRMFYGSPSEDLWEDDEGIVHRTPQGEEGDQGDAMMQLLFAVVQRGALEAIHKRMNPREFLAFHDDVCMATPWADVRSGARRTLCARCHPGSPRQDQGVEPGRHPSCRLQRTGADGPSRGVDRFHDPNCSAKASKWERRSVIPISSPLNWRQWEGNTRCCLTEFLPSVTASVRGCFWSTVLLRGRAII